MKNTTFSRLTSEQQVEVVRKLEIVVQALQDVNSDSQNHKIENQPAHLVPIAIQHGTIGGILFPNRGN